MSDISTEVVGGIGRITLNRARAMNALSLDMIRSLTHTLQAWAADASVLAVLVRGSRRDPAGDPANGGANGPAPDFGHFCAGGDIRFFHQAALAGDPRLEDFFTEEYTLNHLIHHYPKPYVALMDGVVMGGGMGISQGAQRRIVTERSRLAMPETLIGLFPDVGGGWFLGRCPGHLGEYLALTGHHLHAGDAIRAGLADRFIPAHALHALWDEVTQARLASSAQVLQWLDARTHAQVQSQGQMDAKAQAQFTQAAQAALPMARIDAVFGLPTLRDIVTRLEADTDEWSAQQAQALRARSPLMLHVTLEQVRRARHLSLAEALRLERDLVRHSFWLRPGSASETVEGIRALAVDKDHQPRWQPARIEDVDAAEVAAFFKSPWPAHAHPLRHLA